MGGCVCECVYIYEFYVFFFFFYFLYVSLFGGGVIYALAQYSTSIRDEILLVFGLKKKR